MNPCLFYANQIAWPNHLPFVVSKSEERTRKRERSTGHFRHIAHLNSKKLCAPKMALRGMGWNRTGFW